MGFFLKAPVASLRERTSSPGASVSILRGPSGVCTKVPSPRQVPSFHQSAGASSGGSVLGKGGSGELSCSGSRNRSPSRWGMPSSPIVLPPQAQSTKQGAAMTRLEKRATVERLNTECILLLKHAPCQVCLSLWGENWQKMLEIERRYPEETVSVRATVDCFYFGLSDGEPLQPTDRRRQRSAAVALHFSMAEARPQCSQLAGSGLRPPRPRFSSRRG